MLAMVILSNAAPQGGNLILLLAVNCFVKSNIECDDSFLLFTCCLSIYKRKSNLHQQSTVDCGAIMETLLFAMKELKFVRNLLMH